ncbi:decapping enzyme [Brazilian porcupinepox virus 1]|nr:decapping enzyme [Brazilian porcupinepox virus 1]
MTEYYNNILNKIIKYNRKLSKTYTLSDETQKIQITGFNNYYLSFPKMVSICAIILTSDKKYVACSRYNSFLFSEIKISKNTNRKRYLFLNYTKFLKRKEIEILSDELKIYNINYDYDYNNIIFPGGKPKNGEDVIQCLSREIKEETNIDSSDINIDSRFFVHLYIEDLIINKVYNTIIFLGETYLSSDYIYNNFIPNTEIKSLIFLNKYDNGIYGDIVRFTTSISTIKCFGNMGNRYQSLIQNKY